MTQTPLQAHALPMAWRKQFALALCLSFALAGGGGMAAPPAPTDSYLGGAPLGYAVPPVPAAGSRISEMDLVMVRSAQRDASSDRQREAFEDASSYAFHDLLPRFDLAAGQPLSVESHPVLGLMLHHLLQDGIYRASLAKDANPRERPYVEDATIMPCHLPWLAGTEHRSYPSGHATNGYIAALLLAKVMPDRTQAVLERGILYGDNRVVCGVHHPIDVEQGRGLAIAIFERVEQMPAFRADLACAMEERRAAMPGTTTPLSPACRMVSTRAAAEIGTLLSGRH